MLGLYRYDPFLMASVFYTGFCALSDICYLKGWFGFLCAVMLL